jgi:hypothetical protein
VLFATAVPGIAVILRRPNEQESRVPYYNLLIIDQHKTLSTPALDRNHALAIFGDEIGVKLTLEGDAAAAYLLDEWEIGPHWVNPTIPVFAA